MRRLLFSFALLVTLTSLPTTIKAAPQDEPAKNGWTSSLWSPFDGWKAPSFDFSPPKEPAFVKATRQSIGAAWEGTKKTTKNAWDKTIYVLRPYDNQPKPRQSPVVARREADAGFWAGLFRRPAKQEPMTVNEFLKQPTPY